MRWQGAHEHVVIARARSARGNRAPHPRDCFASLAMTSGSQNLAVVTNFLNLRSQHIPQELIRLRAQRLGAAVERGELGANVAGGFPDCAEGGVQ